MIEGGNLNPFLNTVCTFNTILTLQTFVVMGFLFLIDLVQVPGFVWTGKVTLM